ncbi:MAG: hypothetical protein MJ058_08260 [Akkermansia sp.]|nr:hypothetical protein [Akkermansia sp.]
MDDTEPKQPAEAEKKPAKPRKTTTRKAAAKVDGDAGTAASTPKAPKPARKKAAPKAKPAPEKEPAPAPAPKPAPKPAEDDIPNPDARPVLVAPGFAAPETVGGNEGGGRRKRRRNRNRNKDNQQQPQPQQSTRVDPDELVRRAWKIYLGEVTEEGLALMDDRTAQEASRRAFRVAEHFLVEAARHRRPAQQPQQQQPQAQPQQPQPKPAEEPAPEPEPETEPETESESPAEE